jgi:hypothetical protein
MIVSRDVFQVKFGEAQKAISVWKEGLDLFKKLGVKNNNWRMLTDFAGDNFYTLILESEYDSLADYEETMGKIMGNGDWKKWYQKFLPLADSGRREILKVVN